MASVIKYVGKIHSYLLDKEYSRVYGALLELLSDKANICFITNETISQIIGESDDDRVIEYLKRLEEDGLIVNSFDNQYKLTKCFVRSVENFNSPIFPNWDKKLPSWKDNVLKISKEDGTTTIYVRKVNIFRHLFWKLKVFIKKLL